MSRNVREIVGDIVGMFLSTLAKPVAVLAAVLAVAGCTSSDGTDSEARSTTRAPTTTSETSAPTAVTTETACRRLANNEDLAEFWRKVSNSDPVYISDTRRAGQAVIDLEDYVLAPEVDRPVQDAIATAVTQMRDLTQDVSAGAAEFNLERFRGIITPVVTACQDAGVDMAVS